MTEARQERLCRVLITLGTVLLVAGLGAAGLLPLRSDAGGSTLESPKPYGIPDWPANHHEYQDPAA